MTSAEVTSTICAEAVRATAYRFATGLQAVVLTGSLSRDEGTVYVDVNCLRLLGDADFFLVFADDAATPDREEVCRLEETVEAALREREISAHISLGVVQESYFRSMPPYILAYEMRNTGIVVWGKNSTLALIPDFSSDRIVPEDAWRLLGNRMIEFLETMVLAEQASRVLSIDLQYRIAKFYLDMAASYLVFAGRYRSTCRQRQAELMMMAASASPDVPFDLVTFTAFAEIATTFKLSCTISADAAQELFQNASRFARALWTWELASLTGCSVESGHSSLMRLQMNEQSLAEKVRGWAAVARRSALSNCASSLPRWLRLLPKSSPRYAVYAAAAELLFQMPAFELNRPAPIEPFRGIAATLPFAEPVAAGSERTWHLLANSIVTNYREYLITTLA